MFFEHQIVISEDWSNDAEYSALGINYILKYTRIENSY